MAEPGPARRPLRALLDALDPRRRRQLKWLTVLTLANAAADLLFVASAMLFLAALSSGSGPALSPPLRAWLGPAAQDVAFAAIAFGAGAVAANCVRLLYLWLSERYIAGVTHELQASSRRNVADYGTPEFVVVYFNRWSNDPLAGLTRGIHESAMTFLGGQTAPHQIGSAGLAETLDEWTTNLEASASRPYDAAAHALAGTGPVVDAADAELAPLVGTDLVEAAVADVPDVWLADEPGFASTEAVRAAYVGQLTARAAARASWLPSLRALRREAAS